MKIVTVYDAISGEFTQRELTDAEIVHALTSIPQVVTRRQARRALLQAGILDSVRPAIDGIIDSDLRAQAQIDWDDATEFKRDDATLILLAQALELSDEQLDSLFTTAANL